MSETISDSGTLSTVGLEKKSFKGGGGHPPESVANSEMPQGVFDLRFFLLFA